MARRSSIPRQDTRISPQRIRDSRRWRTLIVGSVVSAVVTVTFGIGASTAIAASVVGTARADSYSIRAGNVLTVPDPGVLDNDTVLVGSAAAELRNDVDHGTLDLDEDGGFRYEPEAGFVGTDQFTYRIPSGLLLILPSNAATVTITVTAPPTPAPTPDPTPAPTPAPTPKPTPAPTPRPTPTPTPRPTATSAPLPTIGPVVSLPPVPSVGPLPTLLPGPTATPSARPTPSPPSRPGATASPSAQAARSPDAAAGPISSPPSGGAGPSRSGSGSGSGAAASTVTQPFSIPAAADDGDLDLDIDTALSLRGFDWAIPALVLTVPGILLVLAILTQALIGALWLPVTRRWLGDDRRRRRAQRASVNAG